MKVLYFSTDLGPHDQRFLTALARTRHEVHFLQLHRRMNDGTQDLLPPRIQRLEWPGIGGRFHWSQAPGLAIGLRHVVSDLRPDLIHAGPIQTCAFITAIAGLRPLLCMSWGFDLMEDAERGPLWRWATRYTLRRSSYFVSDAEVTRARAITFGMDPDRTSVFPWGVDLRRFRRPARPRAAGSDHRGVIDSKGTGLVLLCNRSWEKRYGVDVLARAFVKVAPKLPGVSLILIGAGSQAEAIRRILAAGGQMDRVILPGRVPAAEIHRWYHKADLFISPSHVDGSSVSLMEALASGTPVLVSNIPANCEWVTEGVNGWLFEDGDAEDLAQRILWIAKQGHDRARISRAGRKTAERRADWDSNFKVLLQSYDRAAAVGAPS